ncbi:MAG: hypothetical protein ABIR28_04700 [Vicinamibacteria bacterium]
MSLKIFACACSLMIGLARATPAAPVALPRWTHTLPLNTDAINLLTEAAERSPLVTSLIEELERTDVVVYLTELSPGRPPGPSSYLVFLSEEATTRYLLIRIDKWKLSPFERICLLGHELQHALEVAAAPDVRDTTGLASLYRRIGWESGENRFETTAAKSMGFQVKAELLSTMSKASRKIRSAPIHTAEMTVLPGGEPQPSSAPCDATAARAGLICRS